MTSTTRAARRPLRLAAALTLLGTLTACAASTSGEPSAAAEAATVAEPATVADLPALEGVTAGVPEGWAAATLGVLTYAVPAGWADLGLPAPGGWEYRKHVDPATPATRVLEVSVLQGESTWSGGWHGMTGEQGYRLDVPGAALAGVDVVSETAEEAGASTATWHAEIHLQTQAGQYVLVELTTTPDDAGLAEIRSLVGTLALA
ncbi:MULTISPECIES: hypothetical protein [unclassified Actinotalea]|uniref:hypothetical protein n=1 Tax=unclassified Actinotalea TaxID=2638618 RepID=UPI0015F72AD4|nr:MULTISPECIES: hypothetical protein [unclassified Actinotalea]